MGFKNVVCKFSINYFPLKVDFERGILGMTNTVSLYFELSNTNTSATLVPMLKFQLVEQTVHNSAQSLPQILVKKKISMQIQIMSEEDCAPYLFSCSNFYQGQSECWLFPCFIKFHSFTQTFVKQFGYSFPFDAPIV